jgi:prephenate dehydrogenase
MEPSVHDRHMAVVQGLTHFLTICMGRTLQKINMDAVSALSCSTPVFRINYDLIGRLFAQDLGLYKSIINDNKHFNDVFEIFLSSVYEGKSALLSGGEDGGPAYLENIREFFKDSCKDALEESNKIINSLYSESFK